MFDMSLRGAFPKRTLCEVLREINDIHQGSTPVDIKTRGLLVEAEAMGKKMSFKLLEYNKDVYADWWKDNPDYEKKLRERMTKSYFVGKVGG